MAGNGIFIQSSNQLLSLRFPLAPASIRGLPPLQSQLDLTHGLIPATVLAHMLDAMRADATRELYCAVRHDHDRGYQLVIPPQQATGHSVHYQPVADAVLDIPSHPNHAARFSATDDQDENAFRIYGVIGPLRAGYQARISLRAGIYGHRHAVDWRRVFANPDLTGLVQQKTETNP